MSDTEKLADAITRLVSVSENTGPIPVSVALWDSELAAQYLRVSRSHFLQRIAPQPDFPRPSRKLGHPRWKASEVIAWFHQEKAA